MTRYMVFLIELMLLLVRLLTADCCCCCWCEPWLMPPFLWHPHSVKLLAKELVVAMLSLGAFSWWEDEKLYSFAIVLLDSIQKCNFSSFMYCLLELERKVFFFFVKKYFVNTKLRANNNVAQWVAFIKSRVMTFFCLLWQSLIYCCTTLTRLGTCRPKWRKWKCEKYEEWIDTEREVK